MFEEFECITDGVFDGKFGLPAEFSVGFGGVGPNGAKVAGATSGEFVRDFLAGDLFKNVDELKDGIWRAGA